jgi:hypothetical protein
MTPRDHLDPEPENAEYVIGVNTTANEHLPLLHVNMATTMLTFLFVEGRWRTSDHIFLAPHYHTVPPTSVEVNPASLNW